MVMGIESALPFEVRKAFSISEEYREMYYAHLTMLLELVGVEEPASLHDAPDFFGVADIEERVGV